MPKATAAADLTAIADDPDPIPMNSTAVGEISEARVLARLIELGYSVSLPFGNNQRYDLIVDNGTELRRIQVKTGRLRNGYVVFATRSARLGGKHRGYLNEADDFLVYCPNTNEVYRLPVAEFDQYVYAHLRVTEMTRAPRTQVRWAFDYVFNQPVTHSGRLRKPRPTSFPACRRNHPGKPSRIKEKSSGANGTRWYCMDCNLTWNRRARERDDA